MIYCSEKKILFFPAAQAEYLSAVKAYCRKPENIGSFPVEGSFYEYNDDSSQRENLIYQWVKLDKPYPPLYPSQLVPHILNGNGEIFHFVSTRL